MYFSFFLANFALITNNKCKDINMMMKRYSVCVLFMLLFVGNSICAQESGILNETVLQKPVQANTIPDTIIHVDANDPDLKKIVDIRSQFEKQNKMYSAPAQPSESLLRFLKKDELEMSEEALYWARLVRDASTSFDANLTFNDTIVVNPLFMPILFKGDYLPKDLTFYTMDFMKSKSPQTQLYQPDSIFTDVTNQKKLEEMAYQFVQNNYPTHFRYSLSDLPKEIVRAKAIKKNITEDLPLKVESDANFNDVSAPIKFIPERRYWHSGFESAIQFSEGYTSPNWYKGGSENVNLNIFTKNNFRYDYLKDKVQFTNELELKVSLNNAPKDTLHDYKISDDVLRLHSNFGYKAFNKWYYTFDADFKTQMFSNFMENSEVKQAAFLAPFSVTLGLGMKYELIKQFKNKYKNVKLSINMAPFSYVYSYSVIDGKNMNLGGFGFENIEGSTTEFKNSLSQLGSTINADMAFNFSRNVSWQSRLKYFTTYDRIEVEFENTLILAISRFFSTRIYLHVRYDDGVKRTEDFKSYYQVNELLSFGFNYRW